MIGVGLVGICLCGVVYCLIWFAGWIDLLVVYCLNGLVEWCFASG